MRKALFIAYYFPPCSQFGGSIRSNKFVKYLNNYNWNPTVLALSEKLKYNENESNVKRFISATPFNKPFKIEPYGWLPFLYYKGKTLLSLQDYKLIYVSCPPFPIANIASSLKSLSGVPLVVDFRDAWTIGPYLTTNFTNKIINKLIFTKLENNLLTNTDWLIVNSESAYKEYAKKYPFISNRMSLIENGFDEDDFNNTIRNERKGQMTVVYCGSFKTADRNPEPLLKAFKMLILKFNNVSLRIVGDYFPELETIVDKLKIRRNVCLVGKVTHSKAISEIVSSDVLVVTQEPDASHITPVAGKTYEYLRAGRPILAILPEGDNAEMIKRYSARYELVPPQDIVGISRSIERLYNDWSVGKFDRQVKPLKDYIERFNRNYLTSRLSSIFDQLVKNKL